MLINSKEILLCLLLWACETTYKDASGDIHNNNNETPDIFVAVEVQNNRNEPCKLYERFTPPKGYTRVGYDPKSFQHYLRHLPLKAAGSKVLYYDGKRKDGYAYEGVVDLPIGNKNLHQCADAVMRLRADYLYYNNRKGEINFHFTNGFECNYLKWMNGYRIKIRGNQVVWYKGALPGDNREVYQKYLETVFMYAGTLSLSRELRPKLLETIEVGDVFIKGGSPGHAVIVVDLVKHENGNKMFMLAQSYMPAQEIQILKNLNNLEISPWYNLKEIDKSLYTPEWTFSTDQLKTFP